MSVWLHFRSISLVVSCNFDDLVVLCAQHSVSVSTQMRLEELLIIASIVFPDDKIVFIFGVLRDIKGHFVRKARSDSVLFAQFRMPFKFVMEGHLENNKKYKKFKSI